MSVREHASWLGCYQWLVVERPIGRAGRTALRKILTIHYSYLTQTPLNVVIVVNKKGFDYSCFESKVQDRSRVVRLLLPSPLATLCFRESLLSMVVDLPGTPQFLWY